MNIQKKILSIIQFQKDLKYYMPSVLNGPATNSEIGSAEKELNMNFNAALKELYLTANGIKLDGVTPSGKTGIIPIYDLMSLEDAIGYYKNMDWAEFKDVYEIEYELGSKLFPFINDGSGNCYWVDLNEGSGNYGRLYWTNTFGEKPDYLFNSLNDFFDAVLTGYQKNIFFLDKNDYLDCNYSKWRKICHELDERIEYWK